MTTFLYSVIGALILLAAVLVALAAHRGARVDELTSDLAHARKRADDNERRGADLTETRRALGDAIVDCCVWEASYTVLETERDDAIRAVEVAHGALVAANQNAADWHRKYESAVHDPEFSPAWHELVTAGAVPATDDAVRAALTSPSGVWKAIVPTPAQLARADAAMAAEREASAERRDAFEREFAARVGGTEEVPLVGVVVDPDPAPFDDAAVEAMIGRLGLDPAEVIEGGEVVTAEVERSSALPPRTLAERRVRQPKLNRHQRHDLRKNGGAQ